jgi:hypothetical protein
VHRCFQARSAWRCPRQPPQSCSRCTVRSANVNQRIND